MKQHNNFSVLSFFASYQSMVLAYFLIVPVLASDAIAQVGKKPEDGAMQKIAKTALKFLKSAIADLPTIEKLVEICGQLLPVITKFFGLP